MTLDSLYVNHNYYIYFDLWNCCIDWDTILTIFTTCSENIIEVFKSICDLWNESEYVHELSVILTLIYVQKLIHTHLEGCYLELSFACNCWEFNADLDICIEAGCDNYRIEIKKLKLWSCYWFEDQVHLYNKKLINLGYNF